MPGLISSRPSFARSGKIPMLGIQPWSTLRGGYPKANSGSPVRQMRGGLTSFIMFSLAAAPLGCGGLHTEPPPPFELGETTIVTEGDPAKQHKAPFTIAITSPAKDERFKRGENIEVLCSLNIPSGGAMPSKIYVELFDRKDRVVDTSEPVPNSDLGGGRFTLACSVKLPDRVGVYKLLATAIDRVASIGANDSSSRLTTSDPVEVRAQ